MTKLLDMLGCHYPIIQGPIGEMNSPKLVAAICDAGADGLVVSGLESGGLRSTNPESTTMVLVPLVVDHVNVPVVAAGGIADSRGYRAALALGAQGVQVGTRFIVSEESIANQQWKDAILNCSDGDTKLLPQGNINARVIINPKLKEKLDNPNADLSQEYNLMNAPQAWKSGDFDLFPVSAGQVSVLIKEIKPAKAIIEEMVSEGC
jgi:enoyl-[acyl-carrier protein] reductase II